MIHSHETFCAIAARSRNPLFLQDLILHTSHLMQGRFFWIVSGGWFYFSDRDFFLISSVLANLKCFRRKFECKYYNILLEVKHLTIYFTDYVSLKVRYYTFLITNIIHRLHFMNVVKKFQSVSNIYSLKSILLFFRS